MEIYISIDGVLRNFLQKFEYHYKDFYFNRETEEETFEYKINYPITNKSISDNFIFQSQEELDYFLLSEYPLEIYGHAGLTNATSISELNNFIINNPEADITLVGLNEIGKAIPSTLFFLSKNAISVKNIKFIRSEDIKTEWEKCDVWVTDDETVLSFCPDNKMGIKFNTIYNQHYNNKIEINKLTEIKLPC